MVGHSVVRGAYVGISLRQCKWDALLAQREQTARERYNAVFVFGSGKLKARNGFRVAFYCVCVSVCLVRRLCSEVVSFGVGHCCLRILSTKYSV